MTGPSVIRQFDVSALHEQPGEASPDPRTPFMDNKRQAGDSLIILCGMDGVLWPVRNIVSSQR
jgi:hypothetical protein